jgi:hypothetical protein
MGLNGGISVSSDAFGKFANGLGNTLVYVGKKKFVTSGTVAMVRSVWLLSCILNVDRTTNIKIGTSVGADDFMEEAEYPAGTYPLYLQAHFAANTTLYITGSNVGAQISFGYVLVPIGMP